MGLGDRQAEMAARSVAIGPGPQEVDYGFSPLEGFAVRRVDKTTNLPTTGFDKDDFARTGNEWRDLFAHDALSSLGHKIVARPGDAPDRYKNIDLFMDGELWEVKSPHDERGAAVPRPGNELKFVANCLSSAASQFHKSWAEDLGGLMDYDGPVRVILNSRYKDDVDDDLIAGRIREEISRSKEKYVVLHVRKDGSVTELSN